MNEHQHPRERALEGQLTALERSAIMPRVPGELCAWLEEIVRGCLQIEPVLRQRCERDHVRLLDEMRRLDAELSSRIVDLQTESAALPEFHARLSRQAEATLAECRNTGGDEVRLADRLGAVKQAAVEFVLRVRTQEAALATWHQEALNRDRGPVD